MQVGLDSDGCNTGLIPGFTVADVASGGDDAGVKSRGVSDCDSGASAEALDAVQKKNNFFYLFFFSKEKGSVS